ncbi:MAG: hypothetical protein K0B10_00535 [Vicingaceae bacterium]|nr:hypothetical protein [Vicingaceae bacterium]
MKKLKIILSFIVFSIVCITTCFAQTEQKISLDSLPKQVKEQLHHKFHEYSFASILQKTDEKGVLTYLLTIRRDKNSSETLVYYLIYNSNGKLMSKKKEKEFYYTGKEKKSTPVTPSGSNGGHQH